jgi:hypothetical protein
VIGYICESINNRCWNFFDSYGEICVHCGCCSRDAKKRYKARLEVSKAHLAEELAFDGWYFDNPALLELQKKNNKSNVQFYKRRVKYYSDKVKEDSKTCDP